MEEMKKQFLESYENERDIAVVMCAYQRQFGERLTTENYIKLVLDEEEEN
jgi:hypothetical protein